MYKLNNFFFGQVALTKNFTLNVDKWDDRGLNPDPLQLNKSLTMYEFVFIIRLIRYITFHLFK
jgi:hypothetical protein